MAEWPSALFFCAACGNWQVALCLARDFQIRRKQNSRKKQGNDKPFHVIHIVWRFIVVLFSVSWFGEMRKSSLAQYTVGSSPGFGKREYRK